MQASCNLLSMSVVSETLFANLLNSLFGWNLKNANLTELNTAGFDLIDDNEKIIIQVTCDTSSKKMSDTIGSSAIKQLAAEGYRLIILFVGDQNKAVKKRAPQGSSEIGFDSNRDCFLSEDLAVQFMSKSLEGQNSIIELLSKELGIDGDRRAPINSRELLEKIEGLVSSTSPGESSCSAGIVASWIRSGLVDMESLMAAIADGAEGEPTDAYIKIYVDICATERGDLPSIETALSGCSLDAHAVLVSALCAVYDFETALAVAESAQDADLLEMVKIAAKQKGMGEYVDARGGVDSCAFADLALCIEADLLFEHRVFLQAEATYRKIDSIPNPISKVKSEIAALWNSMLYEEDFPIEVANDYVRRTPSWGGNHLLREYALPITHLSAICQAEHITEALEEVPPAALDFFLEANRIVCLPGASTQEVLDTLRDALEDCHKVLAVRTISLLRTRGCSPVDLLSIMNAHVDFVRQHPSLIQMHASLQKEESGHVEWGPLEGACHNEPEYQLIKAEFAEDDSEQLKLICAAFESFAASGKLPHPEFIERWTPLLSHTGNASLLDASLGRFISALPRSMAVRYLNCLIDNCPDAKATSDLAAHLESSGNYDFKGAFVLARYANNVKEDPVKAKGFAVESFELKPTNAAACMILDTCREISASIPEAVRAYIESSQSSLMKLCAADIAYMDGDVARSNQGLLHVILRQDECSDQALRVLAARLLGKSKCREVDAVGAGTAVTLTCGDEQIVMCFHSNRVMIAQEGIEAIGAKHYSTASSEYMILFGLRRESEVSLGGMSCAISSIETIESIICGAGVKLILESPDTIEIHGDPNDPDSLINNLKEVMAKVTPPDLYSNGITLPDGTVFHLGIETGAQVHGRKSVDFGIRVVAGESTVWRPMSGAKISSLESRGFLLSSSAVIMLSLLEFPEKIKAAITAKSYLTETTKEKMLTECREAFDTTAKTPHLLGLEDDNLYLMECGPECKAEYAKYLAEIVNTLQVIRTLSPADNLADTPDYAALAVNGRMDISTARRNEMILVSEDRFESLMIDASAVCERCTLQVAAWLCGATIAEVKQIGESMERANCAPSYDPWLESAEAYIHEVFSAGLKSAASQKG